MTGEQSTVKHINCAGVLRTKEHKDLCSVTLISQKNFLCPAECIYQWRNVKDHEYNDKYVYTVYGWQPIWYLNVHNDFKKNKKVKKQNEIEKPPKHNIGFIAVSYF